MVKSKTIQTAPGGETVSQFHQCETTSVPKTATAPVALLFRFAPATEHIFRVAQAEGRYGGRESWRKQSRYLSRSRNWGGNTRAMPTRGAPCPHGMNHHNASNYNHPKLAPRRHSLSPSDLTEVQDGPVAQPKDACGVVVVR